MKINPFRILKDFNYLVEFISNFLNHFTFSVSFNFYQVEILKIYCYILTSQNSFLNIVYTIMDSFTKNK